MTSPRSILYVTTPTSGSQSIWRLLTALLRPTHQMSVPQKIDGRLPRVSELDPEGKCYIVRGVREIDGTILDPRFRYIVNVRDPRDMACNQYHWLVQHPVNDADDEARKKAEAVRRARFEQGIDASVLRDNSGFVFSYFQDILAANLPAEDVLFISYNQLCCGFDTMVDRLKAFLDVTPSAKAQKEIDLEKTDELANNPKWIGQKWTGTDIMPGRHRGELKPETIATITSNYRDILDKLKSVELPEFQHYYD